MRMYKMHQAMPVRHASKHQYNNTYFKYLFFSTNSINVDVHQISTVFSAYHLNLYITK